MKNIKWEIIIAIFFLVVSLGIIKALNPPEEDKQFDEFLYNYYNTTETGDFR